MLRTTGQSVTRKQEVGRVVSGGRSPGSLGVPGLVLIAVGGVIGAGFFLGVGLPIRTAGPSVLLAFVIGAVVMAQVVGALSSLAIDDPEKGTFMAYAQKYVGNYAGFLQGWCYYIASILTISSESVAMSIFTHLWIHAIPGWVMTSVYAAIVIVINAFGVRNFDRVESLMSVVKIAALVGFILCIGFMLLFVKGTLRGMAGAAPPWAGGGGFFATGATGLFQSMLIVIFAYAGVGVFATAASEMRRPKDINKAAWITVVVLAVLYVVSVALLLFVIPWQQMSTTSSPFVWALQRIGIPLAGPVLNVTILVASFSVMAGAVFSANQILSELGNDRQAPRFVVRTGRNGAPYGSLIVTTIGVATTILVSYLLPANVYNFLISASSYLTFLNWFLILWAFLSWRRQRRYAAPSISSLAFGQPVSTVVTMLLIIFLTVYALIQPDQRIGFYAFAALCVVVSACYFVIPGLRAGRARSR